MVVCIAGVGAMLLIGALMFFVPGKCVKPDRRGDPEAEAGIKRLGMVFMISAVTAGLLVLKFKAT